MTDTPSLDVRAELGKVLTDEHADILREGVALVLHEVMEMEVARLAGGDRYERSEDRTSYRNGYRPRRFDTRVGTLELEIPKLRSGPSYLPSLLEARKRSEHALLFSRDGGIGRRCLHQKSRALGGAARGRGHLKIDGQPNLHRP